MDNLQLLRYVTELERRLDNLARPEQAYHYQPITVVKGWNGGSKDDQALDLQDETWGLPAGIKAVAVWMSYKTAVGTDYAFLEESSGTGAAIFCQCTVANTYATGAGIVNCDSSGDIYFDTNNATNTTYLFIHGYFV